MHTVRIAPYNQNIAAQGTALPQANIPGSYHLDAHTARQLGNVGNALQDLAGIELRMKESRRADALNMARTSYLNDIIREEERLTREDTDYDTQRERYVQFQRERRDFYSAGLDADLRPDFVASILLPSSEREFQVGRLAVAGQNDRILANANRQIDDLVAQTGADPVKNAQTFGLLNQIVGTLVTRKVISQVQAGEVFAHAREQMGLNKIAAEAEAAAAARVEIRTAAYDRLTALPREEAFKTLAAPEFRSQMGLDEAEAANLKGMLQTRFTHEDARQAKAKEEYESDLFSRAADLALGTAAGGAAADPVAARQMILDSDLDEPVKAKAAQTLASGGLNRADDHVYVNALTACLAADPGRVSDAEIRRGVLTGQLTVGTRDRLLDLKELAKGPQQNLIAAANKAIDEAFRSAPLARDTPELAAAEYKTKQDLYFRMTEAKDKGNLAELLDPAGSKYILPGIVQRHRPSPMDLVVAGLSRAQENMDSVAKGAARRTVDGNAAEDSGAGASENAAQPLAAKETAGDAAKDTPKTGKNRTKNAAGGKAKDEAAAIQAAAAENTPPPQPEARQRAPRQGIESYLANYQAELGGLN